MQRPAGPWLQIRDPPAGEKSAGGFLLDRAQLFRVTH
jgi:hypothetical protein